MATKALETFRAFVEIWNREQNLDTPAHLAEMAHWLAESWQAGDRELLLLAFRNSGKSTLVGLFCAWLVVCNPDIRILVLAADLALARKMTRNTKRIIERHTLCEGLKPKRADQWASDQFTVNRHTELRDPTLLAKGISANVTGSRADVVICDDVEVPNTCDSATKREDLRERLCEIDYVLVPGGLQLYVGTPHTFDTIYAKSNTAEEAPFLSGFSRLEVPLLDAKGKPRWPERFTAEKIKSIRTRTGPNKFRSQMLLQPVDIREGRLDADRLHHYADELDYAEMNGQAVLKIGEIELVSATCWWDPSYGRVDRGDASVIACVFSSRTGEYFLHRVRYLTFDEARLGQQAEADQLCWQVVDFVRQYHLPSVIVENNGLGRFLPGLLRPAFAEAGLAASVLEAHSRVAKDRRILEAFDAPLAAGRIHMHESVKKTRFMAEMREWRPGPSTAGQKDDGLDAVAGCLLAEPVRLSRVMARPVNARPDWRSGAGNVSAPAEFDV